jgi:general secretion pathway protein A
MYEEFYGLAAAPFSITPDPRFLFLGRHHREAYDHLLFGITQRKGFIQITGEIGTGKTTLCRAVLEQLGPTFATALILNPVMSSVQLLRSILHEFGLDDRGNDRVRLLQRLNEFLLERTAEGRDVVMFIDEAQDMPASLLEEVRLLSNLETDSRSCSRSCCSAGQAARQLSTPRTEQLRQRILVATHHADGPRQTEAYIAHRLAVAGSNGRPMFSARALGSIHRRSRGVPRLINALCDNTLLAGFVDGTDRLRWRHVRRAARELAGKTA